MVTICFSLLLLSAAIYLALKFFRPEVSRGNWLKLAVASGVALVVLRIVGEGVLYLRSEVAPFLIGFALLVIFVLTVNFLEKYSPTKEQP